MASSSDTDRLFEMGDRYSAEGARALQQGSVDEGRALFERAIAEYRSSLDEAPHDDVLLICDLRLCIGARQQGLGNLDSAVAEYEGILSTLESALDLSADSEAAETHAQARLNRAECRLAEGARDEARREIEDVLAQFPEHAYAQMLLERC